MRALVSDLVLSEEFPFPLIETELITLVDNLLAATRTVAGGKVTRVRHSNGFQSSF